MRNFTGPGQSYSRLSTLNSSGRFDGFSARAFSGFITQPNPSTSGAPPQITWALTFSIFLASGLLQFSFLQESNPIKINVTNSNRIKLLYGLTALVSVSLRRIGLRFLYELPDYFELGIHSFENQFRSCSYLDVGQYSPTIFNKVFIHHQPEFW